MNIINYINFSTNFGFSIFLADMFTKIIIKYQCIKNILSIIILHSPSFQTDLHLIIENTLSTSNLIALYHNKNSEETEELLSQSETEIYQICQQWSDFLYLFSKLFAKDTYINLSEQDRINLHKSIQLWKSIIEQTYVDIFTLYQRDFIFKKTVLKSSQNQFQELLDTVLSITSSFYKIDELLLLMDKSIEQKDLATVDKYSNDIIQMFITILVDIKVIPILFTSIKNLILNLDSVYPTTIQKEKD